MTAFSTQRGRRKARYAAFITQVMGGGGGGGGEGASEGKGTFEGYYCSLDSNTGVMSVLEAKKLLIFVWNKEYVAVPGRNRTLFRCIF